MFVLHRYIKILVKPDSSTGRSRSGTEMRLVKRWLEQCTAALSLQVPRPALHYIVSLQVPRPALHYIVSLQVPRRIVTAT